jgi:hypothetical protein
VVVRGSENGERFLWRCPRVGDKVVPHGATCDDRWWPVWQRQRYERGHRLVSGSMAGGAGPVTRLRQ